VQKHMRTKIDLKKCESIHTFSKTPCFPTLHKQNRPIGQRNWTSTNGKTVSLVKGLSEIGRTFK